jgi:hypothetical protein
VQFAARRQEEGNFFFLVQRLWSGTLPWELLQNIPYRSKFLKEVR